MSYLIAVSGTLMMSTTTWSPFISLVIRTVSPFFTPAPSVAIRTSVFPVVTPYHQYLQNGGTVEEIFSRISSSNANIQSIKVL